jgi:hypothetical protein
MADMLTEPISTCIPSHSGAEAFGAATVELAGSLTSSSIIPAFIPADEAYYWSFHWQADVLESMAALRAGDYEDFDSDDPSDVARWLLSVDDDDA